MKRLTDWLERFAVAINLNAVNWWLRLVLILMVVGYFLAIVFGGVRSPFR